MVAVADSPSASECECDGLATAKLDGGIRHNCSRPCRPDLGGPSAVQKDDVPSGSQLFLETSPDPEVRSAGTGQREWI